MAPPAFNKGIGGCTPLGVLTVNAGTPVQVTANLVLTDKTFGFTCRQLGFSVDSGAGGTVIVNYGNFIGKGLATLLLIEGGQQQSLPIGAVVEDSLLDATKIYVDVAAGAASVAVYALDASS